MQRRAFLSALTTGAALSTLPLSLRTLAQSSWKAEFHEALAQSPWLRGYLGVDGNSNFDATATVTGRLPVGLQGSFYRNGPARHEVGPFRYHHWFDGDGLLQRWHLSEDGVTHRARMIQTRKLRAEQDAGRALYPGFGSLPPDPAPVTGPDLVNTGNISVLHHNERLFALWEAGSPWEMDPDTLETRGIHRFSQKTHGVPFSAHPRVEPDGTLWNFGYLSASNLLVLWHIDAKGNVIKNGTIGCDPITMPHDFLVTDRHLILMLPPFNFERGHNQTFLDSHHWQPDQATRLLIVDKNDFGKHQWAELPAQWVFHFGNAWEDKAGVIRFDGARSPDPSVMTGALRDVMRGVVSDPGISHHYRYSIDTRSGRTSEERLLAPSIHTEFPAIDPRVTTTHYSRLVVLSRDETRPAPHYELNQVRLIDLDRESSMTWSYPEHQLPEEHIFVPAPGSKPEAEGWVVGTAYDWQADCSLLNVFDVNGLADGPIATATLPYALPLGLHGKFVA